MTSSIEDLIPQTGFLGDYIATAREQIMAPVEFHLATGLAALSTAVGRGVKFYLGGWRYPSLWQVVLAPAGAGKSSATAPLRELIEKIRGTDSILPSRFSPEAIYEALSNNPDGLWIMGEIGGFLGNQRRDYMAGLIEDLCEIWDHSSAHRKLRKEEFKIERPAITLIATGRQTDFVDQAGLEMFTSGYMSRLLVLTTNEPPAYRGLRDQKRSSGVPGVEEALASYLEEIGRFRNLPVPVQIGPGDGISNAAVDRWEVDDRRWNDELATVPRYLEGFAKRRGIQALKLAVLHALSRAQIPVVQAEDIAWGCMLAERCYRGVELLTTSSEVGLDRYERRRHEIWQKAVAIASADSGICPTRDLMRSCRWLRNKRELDDQIELWTGSGLARRGHLKPPNGRPAEALLIVEVGKEPPDNWTERT